MAHEDFRQALTRVYLANPCQVLPEPLAITLAAIEGYETAIASDAQGITRLEAWSADRLAIYWRRDHRQPSPLITRRLEFQQSAHIHQDFLDATTVAGFKSFDSQFRLIQRGPAPAAPELPDGFQFARVVNSPDEAQAVAAHLEQAEGGDLDAVQDWLGSPAFTPDLWLWVIDTAADQPAGIAIAEIDPEFHEATLRWVQVFPDYQGQGLGQAAVQELLHRIGGRALFTTVSGRVEDRNDPGVYFRRCEFSGSDVWWSLRR